MNPPDAPRVPVLFVLPVLDPSGAERVVAELALRLPLHGFDTSVLCLENPDAPVGLELKAASVRVDGLRLSRRRTLACAKGLAAHIAAHFPVGPLLVCAHLFHANIAARLALKRLAPDARKRVRVLTTVQVAERRFRPWQFALDRLTAHLGAGEICVSRSAAEFQQQRTGLPAAFFHVIENGVELSRFAQANVPPKSSENLRVVAVGRLDPQKDYPTLLRAWKIVEARLPNAALDIAGSGKLERKLKALSANLNLRRCNFIGYCANVQKFLSGAQLFVQSSAWEGLPLSVIEAMAAGLPVIASAVDSLPDMLDDGVTGWLFPPRDSARLADKICAALGAPEHSGRIGAAGRACALQRFSAERMAAEYAALFRKILERREA